MAFSHAIEFISCIFLYTPIKQRVAALETGDADGLMALALDLGYNLSENELLFALELIMELLMNNPPPTPEEIATIVKQRRGIANLTETTPTSANRR